MAIKKALPYYWGVLAMLGDWGEASRRYRGDSLAASGTGADVAGSLIGVVCGHSSAAIAVTQRRVCGKMTHIQFGELDSGKNP